MLIYKGKQMDKTEAIDKIKKTIIILFLTLFSITKATDFYKPFIPIFPQVSNKRYFKASVMSGLSVFLISDIVRFDEISKSRQKTSLERTTIWQQNMYEQTGNIYQLDSFVPDSSFLDYRSTNPTLYNSYLNAVYFDSRVLEANYTRHINMIWLASIYTYSMFDAFDIYFHKPKQNINSTDAMLRSIIFPGWGQIYVGSYSQAGFIYGMILGFGGHAFYTNKMVNYHNKSILPEHQSKAEKYSTQRTTYLLYILGIYMYNIVDAYVEGELANFSLDISTNNFYKNDEKSSTRFTINYLF